MLSEARFFLLEENRLDLDPRKLREPREARGLNRDWLEEAILLPALLPARLLRWLEGKDRANNLSPGRTYFLVVRSAA